MATYSKKGSERWLGIVEGDDILSFEKSYATMPSAVFDVVKGGTDAIGALAAAGAAERIPKSRTTDMSTGLVSLARSARTLPGFQVRLERDF